jgi:hypothetical protein
VDEFIAKHRERIGGVVSGFDRLVLRATLRVLYSAEGMGQYLSSCGVLLKNFGEHVEQVSQQLKEASLEAAQQQQRPILYLSSPSTRKEDVAREIAKRDNVGSGLVCVLKAVELCKAFALYRNRESKHLDLRLRGRKCLHLYHYWIDPVVGWMSARIQTWFPFAIQVCLNGREWLGRQMEAAGIEYLRQDNCFPWISDYAAAQQLAWEQLSMNWQKFLAAVAQRLNPIHEQIFARFRVGYYWSVYQSEWATDVVFGERTDLRRIYGQALRHAMVTFDSPHVLRFLGRRVAGEHVPARFAGQVTSDIREREEGVRIKHWVNQNSLKLYDKAYTTQGSVLRAEMTMNEAGDFRTYRRKEGDPTGPLGWRALRKGMADLSRRAEICEQANRRYLDALAGANDELRLEQVVQALERSRCWKHRRVRALHPFAGDDLALLRAVSDPAFCVRGFKNSDLRLRLCGSTPEVETRKRQAAAIGRRIRMLRAHSLVRKLPGTHRYRLSKAGRSAITVILTAQKVPLSDLLQRAA